MVTTALFSPSSAVLSTAGTTTTSTNSIASKPLSRPHLSLIKPLSTTLTSLAAAAAVLLSSASPPTTSAALADTFQLYYGTAASAANYGGYGGNSSKRDSAEYTYEVPPGWKERLISKVEKGTNGTDSEFYNPKKRSEREYLTFLTGFRSLAPVDAVLSNLTLSDVSLQDLLVGADGVKSEERRDDKGQGVLRVRYQRGRNKLYAHFVTAPNPEWQRDEETLRRLHESKTGFHGPKPVT